LVIGLIGGCASDVIGEPAPNGTSSGGTSSSSSSSSSSGGSSGGSAPIAPLGNVTAVWGSKLALSGTRLGDVKRVVIGEGTPNEAWIVREFDLPPKAETDAGDAPVAGPPAGIHAISPFNDVLLPFASHGKIKVELSDGTSIDAGEYAPPFETLAPANLNSTDVQTVVAGGANIEALVTPDGGSASLVSFSEAATSVTAISGGAVKSAFAFEESSSARLGAVAITTSGALVKLSTGGASWQDLGVNAGTASRVVFASATSAWVTDAQCQAHFFEGSAAAAATWTRTRGPLALPAGFCSGAFGVDNGVLFGVGSTSTGTGLFEDVESQTVVTRLPAGSGAAFDPPLAITVPLDDHIYFRRIAVSAGHAPLAMHCNDDEPDVDPVAEAQACRAHVYEGGSWKPFAPRPQIGWRGRYAVRGAKTGIIDYTAAGLIMNAAVESGVDDVVMTSSANAKADLTSFDIAASGEGILTFRAAGKIWIVRKAK